MISYGDLEKIFQEKILKIHQVFFRFFPEKYFQSLVIYYFKHLKLNCYGYKKKIILFVVILGILNHCIATPIKHQKIIRTTQNTRQKDKKPKNGAHAIKYNRKKISKKQSTINSHPNLKPAHINTSHDKPLVNFIHKMVNTLHYSSYKLGGSHFDSTHGIYVLDCSNYVDLILKKIHPRAYSRLVNWSKSEKPTTYHYYHFFKLATGRQHYWNIIDDAKKLQPGDIIVFRNKKNLRHESNGHIMVVMDKPVGDKNRLVLRIADSAPYRHSHDTRPFRVSGIGIGTIVLKVNPKTSQPSAYAWSLKSEWKKNVVFAMARPLDMHV